MTPSLINADYLVNWVEKKTFCLICNDTIAVLKEYNIQRHYKTKHSSMYSQFAGEIRAQRYQLLKKTLSRLWLGTRQQLLKLDFALLAAQFPQFSFSTPVRDLGVTLDNTLSFSAHISNLSRSSFYHLRRLRAVRRSVSMPVFKSVFGHSPGLFPPDEKLYISWTKCHKSNFYLQTELFPSVPLPFQQRTFFIKCKGRLFRFLG